MEMTFEKIGEIFGSGDFTEFLDAVKEINEIEIPVTENVKIEIFKGDPQNFKLFKDGEKIYEDEYTDELLACLIEKCDIDEEIADEIVGYAFAISQMLLFQD